METQGKLKYDAGTAAGHPGLWRFSRWPVLSPLRGRVDEGVVVIDLGVGRTELRGGGEGKTVVHHGGMTVHCSGSSTGGCGIDEDRDNRAMVTGFAKMTSMTGGGDSIVAVCGDR
ncbi:hypothetical protein RIF29_20681 [Crotalaria pallida]|uniref:Uncharacterized protein n=1 Tax=Crotalaria pallida TaxID=3830 RepID=A0AAN9I7Q9_CROPI